MAIGLIEGIDNSQLVQAIVNSTLDGQVDRIIVSLFMLIFTFTSQIWYYSMSESNIRFIKDNKRFIMAVRILVIGVMFLSCTIGIG